MVPLYDHHQQTINNAVEFFRKDSSILAVIVGGSIAKGVARPDSDVDLILVVTAEEYARRRWEKAYTLLSYDFHDYPGGYVDAKYVDVGFLHAAAERGSEPTRDAFTGVYPAWSRLDGLEAMIARIPVYPEQDRETKMRAFYSNALIQQYFIGHGVEKHRFLVTHAASTMVLFAGRLLLAYNRVLFPSQKRLLERVAALAEKPGDFLNYADRLLCEPSSEAAHALMDSLNGFHDWGLDWDTALGQFTEDAEFNWLDGKPPLAAS